MLNNLIISLYPIYQVHDRILPIYTGRLTSSHLYVLYNSQIDNFQTFQ